MPAINKIAPKISLMKKMSVRKIQNQFRKQGFSDITTRMSKNGTIAIIGTKGDRFEKQALTIKPDGQRILKTYERIESGIKGLFNRKIQTLNVTSKDPIFVSQSTLYYENHKLPSLIRTLPEEAKDGDAVEIIYKSPLNIYVDHLSKK